MSPNFFHAKTSAVDVGPDCSECIEIWNKDTAKKTVKLMSEFDSKGAEDVFKTILVAAAKPYVTYTQGEKNPVSSAQSPSLYMIRTSRRTGNAPISFVYSYSSLRSSVAPLPGSSFAPRSLRSLARPSLLGRSAPWLVLRSSIASQAFSADARCPLRSRSSPSSSRSSSR